MEIKGKTALVTGGAGGIGSAITRALVREGVHVIISFVENLEGDQEAAEQLLSEMQATGVKCATVPLDQRDHRSILACVDTVINEWGQLDILVNNAGWNIGIDFADLDTLTEDIWDRVLETNLRGPFLLSRAFAKHLRANGSGRIVNIASIGGLTPMGSSMAYSCSKAGLIHLTRCLAVALGPDVTVNAICPGLVEGTRMAKNLTKDVEKMVRDLAVLKRGASAQDIAEQAVLLCKSETITGQAIAIDAGIPGAMR